MTAYPQLHETFHPLLRDPVTCLRLVEMWIDGEYDYMCGHEGTEDGECPDEDAHCSLAIEPEDMAEALGEHDENLARLTSLSPSDREVEQ